MVNFQPDIRERKKTTVSVNFQTFVKVLDISANVESFQVISRHNRNLLEKPLIVLLRTGALTIIA